MPNNAVVAAEPERFVDLQKQFYLLPVLDASTTVLQSGFKARTVKVASITRDATTPTKAPDAANDSAIVNFNSAVVFVIDATSQVIKQSLDLLINNSTPEGLAHLEDVREIFEPEIAARAAIRAEPKQLAAMRDAIEAMERSLDDSGAYIEADLDFHLALAEAAQNPLVLTLIDSIVGLLRVQRTRVFHAPEGPARGQHHHRRILHAVENHDPEAARAAMQSHLEQVREDSQVVVSEPEAMSKG